VKHHLFRRRIAVGVAMALIMAMVTPAGGANAATVTTVPRSQTVTIDLIAATLRRLGDAGTAADLQKDFKRGVIRFTSLGGAGVNAETGQEGGRNVMDIEASLIDRIAGLEKVLRKRPYGPSSVLVDVALTVRHEYVHMRQVKPDNVPEFEDPAYLEVGGTLRRWLRKLEAERTVLLARRPSATRTKDLAELSDLVAQLGPLTASMREAYERNVSEGKVSADLPVGFDQVAVRVTSLQASLGGPTTTATGAGRASSTTVTPSTTTIGDLRSTLPGTWKWFVNGDVTFAADGTLRQPAAGLTGTWRIDGTRVVITWSHGYTDKLQLVGAKRLEGFGSQDAAATSGFPVSGEKAG
jgi:hypothetical protein